MLVKENYQTRHANEVAYPNGQVVATYRRGFFVETTQYDADAADVKRAAGIPRVGDCHPTDTYARCNEVDAKPRLGHPTIWDVNVAYSFRFVRT
jgi:hypothetical protein